MGVFGDGDNRKKGKTRGATNVRARLDAFGARERQAMADWSAWDAFRLADVIHAATRMGGAVSFGLSRDKGAYNVTLFLDGDRRTIWISGSDNVDEKLLEIAETLRMIDDER